MSKIINATTSKDGKERLTVIVLDKIQAFQTEGDRLNIFVDGSIFSVSQDREIVWAKLIEHFGGFLPMVEPNQANNN